MPMVMIISVLCGLGRSPGNVVKVAAAVGRAALG